MSLKYKEIKGEKTPLIFIHGYCEDKSMWDNFTHYFKEHHILLIDMPGFGESPVQKNLSLEGIADQVHELMKEKRIAKGILIGHSMGGYVSCAFASKFGSALQGLCLFHSHPFDDSPQNKKDRKKAIDFMSKNGTKNLIDTLVPKLFAESNEKRYPKEIEFLKERAYQYPKETMMEGMDAMMKRESHVETVTNLEVPFLSILGKKDRLTTYDVCRPQIVLPKIGMTKIHEDMGHLGMVEDPDACASALEDFIKLCDQF